MTFEKREKKIIINIHVFCVLILILESRMLCLAEMCAVTVPNVMRHSVFKMKKIIIIITMIMTKR